MYVQYSLGTARVCRVYRFRHTRTNAGTLA